MASTARPRYKLDTRYVQQESITTCIRNNINEYGSGTMCLKEMLANADDAGAKHFTVCLDKSSYKESGLLHADMASWQGPAVFVHNDALITDADCESYTRKVGDSSKFADKNTVGKFGKGAMTAYYLSDGIQCLSGNHLLILDPHQTHLPDSLPSVRGELVHPRDEFYVDMQAEAPGQIEPFTSFSKACSSVTAFKAGSHYPGTVFRLAFRTTNEARVSKISQSTICADAFADTTLKQFTEAAADLLLFTRNVSQISVYTKADKDSTAELLHHSKASYASMAGPDTLSNMQMQKVTISTQHSDNTNSSKVWARAISLASSNTQDGVTALLQQTGSQITVSNSTLPEVNGKVYVTLPMPFSVSGLPLHINGAFWIQADRRKLWSGENDGGKGDLNKAILVQWLAPAWAAVLSTICHNSTQGWLGWLRGTTTEDPTRIYRLWPSLYNLHPVEIRPLVSATFSCILSQRCKVLWAPTADTSANNKGQWVCAQDACFASNMAGKYPQETITKVINVARRAGLLIADAPAAIYEGLQQAACSKGTALTVLSPAVLRQALKLAGNIVKPNEVETILSYVASDKKYDQLDGLCLLLLTNKTVQKFCWSWSATSQQRSSARQCFTYRDAASKATYELLPAGTAQLAERSETLAWAQYNNKSILESGFLNVRLPNLDDIAAHLPAAWKGDTCKQGTDDGRAHPTVQWLEKFWTMFSALSKAILPSALQQSKICKLTNNYLASPAYCSAQCILTAQQVQALPGNASQTLTAAGCLTLADHSTDHLGEWCGSSTDPITEALPAAAARQNVTLSQMVSEQHLGSAFHSLRAMLAQYSPKANNSYSQMLKKCKIFERLCGQLVSLERAGVVLPSSTWECLFRSHGHLLDFGTIILAYHSASPVSRRLADHLPSNAYFNFYKVPSISHFVNQELLPKIYNANDPQQLPFLLQALNEFVADPSMAASEEFKIFADGRLCQLKCCVDSTSDILSFLFAKQHQPAPYTNIIPDAYISKGQLSTLKRLGLAHEGMTDPALFLACSNQLQKLSENRLTEQQTYLYSQKLVRMLHSNLHAYLRSDSSIKYLLAQQTVYRKALHVDGCPESATSRSQLVSLADSEDYKFHQLVASAAPLTDPAMGDTTSIRTLLGLPTGPQPINVIKHLQHTAEKRNKESASHPAFDIVPDSLQDHVKQAYSIIVDTVSNLLASTASKYELDRVTDTLKRRPWVLVQGKKFVTPELLYFDLDEETSEAPVTDPAMGDTTMIRSMLGLPTGPQPNNVIKHLQNTARARNRELASDTACMAVPPSIQENVKEAYKIIVETASSLLAASSKKQELKRFSAILTQAPWVLVQNSRFVLPEMLYFDLEEELTEAFEVPQDLLTLVQDDSNVIKWLIGSMHITHMTEGAPIVKISTMNPVHGVFKGPDFLLDMFNNSKRHPDLVITAHGHDILVHKCIVACGSNVLNRQWDALWLQDDHPGLSKWTIDSTACPFCNVGTAYSTAHMFFSFFYTGEVKWPDNIADAYSALELLVLASIYNVPFLVQAAEVALKNHISNRNCFVLLTVADHHSAQQLRSFSLYYIANGFKLLSKSAEYQNLSDELANEVEQVRASLK